jgi:uncharacterized protein
MVFNIEEVGVQGLHFNFKIKKEQLEIDKASFDTNIDIDVSGCLTRVGNDVYLEGKVGAELSINCSRCLDLLIHTIDSNFKTHFVPSNTELILDGEIELITSDIDTEFYDKNLINLTQSVRDGLLLAVPAICLCSNDCKGICSRCGKKLNYEACECFGRSFVDPRLDVLRIIKNKIIEGG